MGWFSGKYDDDNDASRSNTVSDKEWRAMQARAGKANNHRRRLGSEEQQRATKRGADNYNNRWWN